MEDGLNENETRKYPMTPVRYTILHQDKGLAFGYDAVCGEFLRIWEIANPNKLLVDLDSSFFVESFSKNKILELLKEHGFTEDELSTIEKE